MMHLITCTITAQKLGIGYQTFLLWNIWFVRLGKGASICIFPHVPAWPHLLTIDLCEHRFLGDT